MKLSKLIHAGAFATLAVFGSANAATNLISNGGFETFTGLFTGNYAKVTPSSGTLESWIVGGTSIDVIKNQYGAINGNSIDMLGSPGPGSLSQSFSTTAGSHYLLSFDLARNEPDSSLLTVNVAGKVYEFTGTTTAKNYMQSFTALTNNTTLLFSSANVVAYGGAVLDNVSVSAVPEPSTYALMLGGLGLMGFMARRRKQG